MSKVAQLEAYVRNVYRSAIGRPRRELVTPALILDLDAARRNIQFMARRLSGMKAKLRPHVKVQKSAELARLQIEAGAIGVCTATVWEAIVMSQSGIEDVLIANQVGGKEKIKALAAAAKDGRMSVAVDDVQNARDLSDAARAAGSSLEVLIEVDVGMGRGGVRSSEEGASLAQHISKLPGLKLRGVQGYEGHCMLEPDRAVRIEKARAAMDYLGSVIDQLTKGGFACEVVSAGGTGTYDITGDNPRVTEIQAGSYVFMDATRLAIISEFTPALTVLATVVSRQGTTLVLDAGKKTVGVDFTLPPVVGFPPEQAVPRVASEEHLLYDVTPECLLAMGDRVEVIPGYCPTTVNLHDAFHVVQDGIVVDIWPVMARGTGRGRVG